MQVALELLKFEYFEYFLHFMLAHRNVVLTWAACLEVNTFVHYLCKSRTVCYSDII